MFMEEESRSNLRYAFRSLVILDSVLEIANQNGYVRTKTDAFVRATTGDIHDLSFLFTRQQQSPSEGQYEIPVFYEPNSVEDAVNSAFNSDSYQRILAIKNGQVELFDIHVDIDGKLEHVRRSSHTVMARDLLYRTESGKKILSSLLSII